MGGLSTVHRQGGVFVAYDSWMEAQASVTFATVLPIEAPPGSYEKLLD